MATPLTCLPCNLGLPPPLLCSQTRMLAILSVQTPLHLSGGSFNTSSPSQSSGCIPNQQRGMTLSTPATICRPLLSLSPPGLHPPQLQTNGQVLLRMCPCPAASAGNLPLTAPPHPQESVGGRQPASRAPPEAHGSPGAPRTYPAIQACCLPREHCKDAFSLASLGPPPTISPARSWQTHLVPSVTNISPWASTEKY